MSLTWARMGWDDLRLGAPVLAQRASEELELPLPGEPWENARELDGVGDPGGSGSHCDSARIAAESMYKRLVQNYQRVKATLPKNSALTLTHKILYAHLIHPNESNKNYLLLRPDRVAMQDASAQ
jgi:hypothetical protein